MSVSAPAAQKPNGLTTVVNVIAAPSEAFETLRIAPTWGWALIVAIVLMAAAAYLEGPAVRHATLIQIQQAMSTSPLYANLTPEQKQHALTSAGKPSVFSYVGPLLTIFIAVFFNTLFMLVANAVGRGEGDFKRFWCGSMNIAVPTLALGSIVTAAIIVMRGPDGFTSVIDVARATPSLASFIANRSPDVEMLLASISIFSLWGVYLNAAMLRVLAKVQPAIAYGFAIGILVLGALFAAGYAGLAHHMGLA